MANWENNAAVAETSDPWQNPDAHSDGWSWMVAEQSPWYDTAEESLDSDENSSRSRRLKVQLKKIIRFIADSHAGRLTCRRLRLRRSPRSEESHESSIFENAWAACGFPDHAEPPDQLEPSQPPVDTTAYMTSDLAVETRLMDREILHSCATEPWDRVHVDYEFGQQRNGRDPKTSQPYVPADVVHVLQSQLGPGSEESTSDLRNAGCHPEPLSALKYDRLLEMGQRIAIVLEHGECAHRIRALRDQLRDELRRTVAEIMDNEHLQQPEFDRFWKQHHRATFARAIADLEFAAWQKEETWGQSDPVKFEVWPEVLSAARR
ncbi:hypothetical protein B0T22DRAFT_517097 [Podospora appendiculata]|uniref:Uncharacterized protein n=1 Tax=Podospora appendiculata TaxID=314037 RepID=A0AAE0X501_9PEZI|nr:hypothetical protein B0T22DRAFT_517097 [Podospora appendiculata]